MKKKLALVHCVHHKPWLIMSTLISTSLQSFQEYDIYFLYNKGNGELHYRQYKKYFNEYCELIEKYGKNKHLDSTFDEILPELCKLNRININEIIYEDDHGLDSGAWYKFIKSGTWKDYEYVLFMGEGAILTSPTVLSDTLNYSIDNNVHFITGSNHKRFLSKSMMLNGLASMKYSDALTRFNDRMINKSFSFFCRDPEFSKIMESWKYTVDTDKTPQEHHIPDIWGKYGILVERLLNKYSKLRLFHDSYLRLRNSILIQFANRSSYKYSRKAYDSDEICVNFKKIKLESIVNFRKYGNTKFHLANEIGWYGTYCNHFMSNILLSKLEAKLEKYKIYDAMKIPYAAGPLEPIWGLIPAWLGHKICFFDGIHRVCKNFLNYDRIDNPDGMARYLNQHYKGIISVINNADYIQIKSYNNQYKKNIDKLNKYYLY